VPKPLLKGLIKAIDEEGLSLEWLGSEYNEESLENLVEAINNDVRGHLDLSNEEVSGGMFYALEAYCYRNEIAFDRWSDGCGCEWGSSVRHYRPNSVDAEYQTDNDGAKMLRYHVPRLVRDLLIEAVHQKSPEIVKQALQLLDKEVGPEITDLPPLEITDH